MLDASMLACDFVDFPDSEFVNQLPDGTLQFASLRVGVVQGGGEPEVLDDSLKVDVRGNEVSIQQIKEYLHGFADSIGTDVFAETLDLRRSPWGSGSGSTTQRFETFISDELSDLPPCHLRFAGDVSFTLPDEGGGGPFEFTGGFLDLREDGFSSLLRGGDIAEIVDGYEIVTEGGERILKVDAQLGPMEFVINADKTLTDEFDRVWSPDDDYELIDPDAVDYVLGDIDRSGTVDFADFLVLSKNFGTAGPEGDIDCDGEVDFADFLILSGNFGKS